MGEREPVKETIGKGEIFFLCHSGTEKNFSGYGLTVEPGRKDYLVGLLMIDRPKPVDPEWLKEIEVIFGEYQLVAMTASGERGIACQMQIEPESQAHIRQCSYMKAPAIKTALEPLLDEPPNPVFTLRWDDEKRAWQSQIAYINELPKEVHDVFEKFGYGCLAVEADIGIVHVCHATDVDIEGFANKPVLSRWQLITMPTAPLIRLELVILDRPDNPYKFESFLNVTEEDQAQVFARLANQDRLYLAFYGDDLTYRYAKVIPQERQQWQQIDDLAMEAMDHWSKIPAEKRDFDLAKVEFMRQFM